MKRLRNRLTYGKKYEKELAGSSPHYGDNGEQNVDYGDKGEKNLDHGDKNKKERASGK